MSRVVCCIALAGCTALTDFSQFHNSDSADLAALPDLSGRPIGAICEPINGRCDPGLMCKLMPGMIFLCTKSCNDQGSCPEGSNCVQAEVLQKSCLPTCNIPADPCANGLICCQMGRAVTSGDGTCLGRCP